MWGQKKVDTRPLIKRTQTLFCSQLAEDAVRLGILCQNCELHSPAIRRICIAKNNYWDIRSIAANNQHYCFLRIHRTAWCCGVKAQLISAPFKCLNKCSKSSTAVSKPSKELGCAFVSRSGLDKPKDGHLLLSFLWQHKKDHCLPHVAR